MFYFRRSARLVGRVTWLVSKHTRLRHATVCSNTHERRWTQTFINSNHVDGVMLSPKSMRCIRGCFPFMGGRSIRFTQWLKWKLRARTAHSGLSPCWRTKFEVGERIESYTGGWETAFPCVLRHFNQWIYIDSAVHRRQKIDKTACEKP